MLYDRLCCFLCSSLTDRLELPTFFLSTKVLFMGEKLLELVFVSFGKGNTEHLVSRTTEPKKKKSPLHNESVILREWTFSLHTLDAGLVFAWLVGQLS